MLIIIKNSQEVVFCNYSILARLSYIKELRKTRYGVCYGKENFRYIQYRVQVLTDKEKMTKVSNNSSWIHVQETIYIQCHIYILLFG